MGQRSVPEPQTSQHGPDRGRCPGGDPPADLAGLSCFGDKKLRFQAWFSIIHDTGCVGTSGPWTIHPAWLGPCKVPIYRLAEPDDDLRGETKALQVTIHPSVDLDALPALKPDHWLLVDVVGRFAHPAADRCTATPTGGDGEGPPRPEIVVLDCRSQFVVTSLTAHQDT